LRTREVVALEAVEAESARHVEMLLRIDPRRQQQLARRLQHARQLGQQRGRRTHDVDLDGFRVGQQFCECLVGLVHLVEHEAIAAAVQMHDARNQLVVDLNRRRQFEHEAIVRQTQNGVVEQHLTADVEVRRMPGERPAHAAMSETADDRSRHALRGAELAVGRAILHFCRCFGVVGVAIGFGRGQRRCAYLDFVTAQHAVPIQNRLSCKAGNELRSVGGAGLRHSLDCDGGHSSPPLERRPGACRCI
jgi:hypothetical protein